MEGKISETCIIISTLDIGHPYYSDLWLSDEIPLSNEYSISGKEYSRILA